MAEGESPVEILSLDVRKEPSLPLDRSVKELVMEFFVSGRLGTEEEPLSEFEATFWFSMPPTVVICGEVELDGLNRDLLKSSMASIDELVTDEDRAERLKDAVAVMVDGMIIEFIEKAHDEPYMVMHQGRNVNPDFFNGIIGDS